MMACFPSSTPHLPKILLVLASTLILTSCAAQSPTDAPILDLAPETGPKVPKVRTDETTSIYMAQQDLALDKANAKLEAAAKALRLRKL